MNTLVPDTDLDELLAPFERRPVLRDAANQARARDRLAFGRELARLQGAHPNPVRERIAALVVAGQASPREAMELAAEIARRGLFTRGQLAFDDGR
ncbi:MAG TPA: hypothetical protein VNZ57_15040 [Longimicrobiales bacterium]|nr:hypothetical protein [Longimicrobiales bacterium]